jgi:hypothetical protein
MAKKISVLSLLLIMIAASGCGSARKQAPHMGFSSVSMETKLERKDVVVMNTVEGTSTATNILFFITIVDGDKLAVFGIPFFKDKYTYFDEESWHLFGPSVVDRAYYKALEAAPEADSVFLKSSDSEAEGIPFIFRTETVTWKGKALKLKADQ